MTMDLFSSSFQFPGYLTDTMALAAVALLGYLFGHRTRKPVEYSGENKVTEQLNRAVRIAFELQDVTEKIRKELAKHQTNVSRFQSRVESASHAQADQAWNTLTGEAEALLGPTLNLSTHLSAAYDQLRQHSAELMNFAGSRTDAETGVGNRRALEEHLATQFISFELSKHRFSLAMFSISPESGEPADEAQLAELRVQFAKLVDHTARDTDFVARYSDDEFAVLMSHTTLAGATVFSERLLRLVEVNLNCVISGGLAEIQTDDDSEKLFSRVDSALYSARSNGRNCLFMHNGRTLRQLNSGGDIHPVQSTQEWTEDSTKSDQAVKS